MMSVKDEKGQSIEFGDYVIVRATGEEKQAVGRICDLTEGPKGTKARAAFVEIDGGVRIVKRAIDPAKCALVMKSVGATVIG